MKRRAFLLLVALAACRREAPAPVTRPSILLVTLDTTRADAIGPDTPSFNALVRRGRSFHYAYATVPQTLPSHGSMMTGLYPAGHGVHENARFFAGNQPLLAEELHKAGYRTAAFVSAFALARRFGLARGFDLYDENFANAQAERPAQETTDRALAWLAESSQQPRFLWVHYYDPHYPYVPPEPFRTRYAANPYRGEVASMDAQLGRLLDAFQKQPSPTAIVVVADHGEGLGEHGEQQHGNLLYQATMHVPLVIAGPGITAGFSDTPVSTRRVFHTILDWAGIASTNSLRASDNEVVLGEAMRPFLDYGWQPQVMAVDGQQKTILAGTTEVYDVVADPHELHNLADRASVSRSARAALRDYPIPSAAA
ncbi:MAG TPA: sulfatase, partial [Thermoanaerobaculia bacterium]|nr:sulfatase [Thermoanaerobaculia bacterium]